MIYSRHSDVQCLKPPDLGCLIMKVSSCHFQHNPQDLTHITERKVSGTVQCHAFQATFFYTHLADYTIVAPQQCTESDIDISFTVLGSQRYIAKQSVTSVSMCACPHWY